MNFLGFGWCRRTHSHNYSSHTTIRCTTLRRLWAGLGGRGRRGLRLGWLVDWSDGPVGCEMGMAVG